mmetsp:Transcript_7828/g.8305  ORF Transcript_7828/g.8305 Transcript_7828/m.8305 type:complete len:273 (-) Transcript_7828:269-1087(-)
MSEINYYIAIVRHTEREDRAVEAKGGNWINSAPYPQDPPLSELGHLQAIELGNNFKDTNPTVIYASPMTRTIQTADHISNQLIKQLPIFVEPGLVEESISMRGQGPDDPKPVLINDSQLYHPVEHLYENHSNLIELSYEPLRPVYHAPDHGTINKVREQHDTLTHRDEITRDRCCEFISKLKQKHFGLSKEEIQPTRIICVGHGASCDGCVYALEEGIPEELKIRGSRSVGAWAIFVPVDPNNLLGSWYSPDGVWKNVQIKKVENNQNVEKK